MIRQFQFEAEVYESLSCVPMQARRKLDAVGVKIHLAQWQQLTMGEKLMICHAPAELEDERVALRLFIEEVTLARSGSCPKELPEEARGSARPPLSPPHHLVANARELGVDLTQAAWNSLDDDERYALIKLGGEAKVSHNLKAALGEFLALHAPSANPAT
ncbi:MAG TPA: nitrate reductase associated protein [Candidatus Binataceae bacterium]|nr:nitrate reductase associated protein [Candidatus Binataceae bacterium]